MAKQSHQILSELLNISIEELKSIQDNELQKKYKEKFEEIENDEQMSRSRTALKHAYEQLQSKSQRDEYFKNLGPQTFMLSADSKGNLYEIEDLSAFKADQTVLNNPALKAKFDDFSNLIKNNQLDKDDKVKLTPGFNNGKPCILISIQAKDKNELEEIQNKFRADGYTIVPLDKKTQKKDVTAAPPEKNTDSEPKNTPKPIK